MQLHRPASLRLALGLISATIVAAALTACSPAANEDGVIHVPSEVKTLTEAEEQAEPGDLILIAPGTYLEQMLITTPDITVRGEDRNDVVIDGEGVRPYGIVSMADGVRVENLTVQNATFYGLLFTGLHDDSGPQAPTATSYEAWDPSEFPPLQRFLADHITAINNGLYGIYAFNSQHGAIVNSYTSGSADSGLYVGQCVDCDILVQNNVAERNAVGFENANASDSVIIAGNRLTDNRIGLTLLSSYQEQFAPQRTNNVVGNLIANNAAADTPSQATGAFGTGIGISGGVANLIERNTITGNPRAGVIVNNEEDLSSYGNAFIDNVFADNGADYVNASPERAPAFVNCVSGSTGLTTLPVDLAAILTERPTCEPVDNISGAGTVPEPATTELGGPDVPPGISFLDVAHPIAQPNLPQADSYPRLPDAVTMPSLDDYTAPGPELLVELTGTK